MAGVCRPLSICARTVGGAALFVGVVLMWRVQLINQSMFAAPLPVRADERCARARNFFHSHSFYSQHALYCAYNLTHRHTLLLCIHVRLFYH